MKITKVINDVLRPWGFRRSSNSWLRHRNGILTRISFYVSRFDDTGYIDITFTVIEVEPLKQPAGEWDASERIEDVSPIAMSIRDCIKSEIDEGNAQILKKAFEQDVYLLLEKFKDPAETLKEVIENNWFRKKDLTAKLTRLIERCEGDKA